MKYLAIALASAALTGAQTPTISILPPASAATGARTRFAAPVLGYVNSPGSLDVQIVFGTPKGAQLGGNVVLPANVKRLFVPPREHYLLLESKSLAEPLAVWQPLNPTVAPVPLPAGPPHPDRVAFSSRGDTVVLYSKSTDRLQVLTGFPAEPVLKSTVSLANWGEPLSFTVSDDGELVVAFFADGSALLSAYAQEWQTFPAAYGVTASLFISRTHNLVISDSAQQTLTLISNVAEPTQSARIVRHNTSADRLAVNKEGTVLLAASSAANKAWTIDLKTLASVSQSFSSIDSLLPLRDGHTFLLSAAGLALLNVPLESDSVAALVPVSRK